jgi:citrate synthase
MKGKTSICGFDAETITVRGRDLVSEIMGHQGFTEYLLLQALGKAPKPAQVKIVDAVMVTIMEHGLVPSAVVTRLTYHGAPESFQGAIAAGLLGVGDRYAGTAGLCGAILEQIVAAGEASRAAEALEIVRAHGKLKRPVPGFGHPIHAEADPRVPRLIEITRNSGVQGNFLDALDLLQDALRSESGKLLVTNISAAIGAALGEAGVPARLMRGIVLTARCAGLVGHLFEEMNRPAAEALWKGAQSAVTYDP